MSPFAWKTRSPKARRRRLGARFRAFYRPYLQVLEARLAPAFFFLVKNTDPNGPDSLDDAIKDCNELPSGDTCNINFRIQGAGPHTIKPTGQLDAITYNNVTIDGTTQPGYNGTPLIVLNGANAGSASGLVVKSNFSTIKGLVINDFAKNGIEITGVTGGGDNNRIESCYIGTNAAGTADVPNNTGVLILLGAQDNVVGGTVAAARNVISGNATIGVEIGIGSTDNEVQGNYIGTNAGGTAAVPNEKGVKIATAASSNTIRGNVISGNNDQGIHILDSSTSDNLVVGNYIGTDKNGGVALGNDIGITISGEANNNTVGGFGTSDRNVISGNDGRGVEILFNAKFNQLIGNYIGTNSDGDVLGNGSHGVVIDSVVEGASADDNPVGDGPLGGNVIAYNEGAGIRVVEGISNPIRQNSIYRNVGKGIVLVNNGNNKQPSPTIDSVTRVGPDIVITGTLQSDPTIADYNLDFFSNSQCDSSGNGEGETFLDDLTVTTNGSGFAPFTATITSNALPGQFITATATKDAVNDTSEFSNCKVLDGFVVTKTDDSGLGSLRQAIIDANNDAGLDAIVFLIDGIGVHTIKPLSPLPDITNPVIINGYSQPGSSPNTKAIGNNAVLKIEIDGSLAGPSANGLKFKSASGSTVKGLAINRFGATGVFIDRDPNQTDMVIEGNFIGTDITGTIAHGNGFGIFLDGGNNNRIGGSTAAARNVVSGNIEVGVQLTGTNNNIIAGNYIGTDRNGTADLGNGTSGIYLGSTLANTIGGFDVASRNVISGNSHHGIVIYQAVGDIVRGNYIGTDVNGSVAIGNNFSGVYIEQSNSNLIGSTPVGAGNVISGNQRYGIQIQGFQGNNVTDNQVQGNYIGTDAGGTVAIGNGFSGVYVNFGSGTIIGGTSVGARNVISGGFDTGVTITNSSANFVQGNYIGTDVTGTADLGNDNGGVYLGSASNNLIGGTIAGSRNVISGNLGSGLIIQGSNAKENDIQGNYIGVNAAGTGALGNTGNGVYVLNAPDNTIGGTTAGSRNVISGNLESGIRIFGDPSTNNFIQGNYIGTDAGGTIGLGNGDQGIHLDANTSNNTVGGVTAQARNVISGNGNGIHISFSGGHTVQGNYIGTDFSGMSPLGNLFNGIQIVQAANNTIGGDTLGARNIISGNSRSGILFANSDNNQFFGNYVGLNANGNAIVANAWDCISSVSPNCDGITIGEFSDNNTIGGTTVGERNVISGNGKIIEDVIACGITISEFSTGNRVQGNYIGTDATGTQAFGNVVCGVIIRNSNNNTIGGTTLGSGNIIAASQTGPGVFISGSSDLNNVQGNYIGTDKTGTLSLGNFREGVHITSGASTNTIGGALSGAANLIAYNGETGIRVYSGTGNSFRRNSIFANGLLGINLGNDGITENDANDIDPGPNNLQNFPVLNFAFSTPTFTVVRGSLNSTPNTTFTIEFFNTPTADPSGYGEGQNYIGTRTVTTNANGNVPVQFRMVSPLVIGSVITATATDPFGNTSEFSLAVTIASGASPIPPPPAPTPLPGPASLIDGPPRAHATHSELSDGRRAYDFSVLVTASEETESVSTPEFIRRPSRAYGIDCWPDEGISMPAFAIPITVESKG